MADTNFLTRIFTLLESDAGILAAFTAANIIPEMVPIEVDSVKLTVSLEEGYYTDNDTDIADLILKIWVRKDKFTGSVNGWTKCKQLTNSVDAFVNLSGDSVTNVYSIRRKTKADPVIDPDDPNLYMGVLIYEVNKYEG